MLQLGVLILIIVSSAYTNVASTVDKRISEKKCDEYKILAKTDCPESSPDCAQQTNFCNPAASEAPAELEARVKPGEFPHMAAIGWKTDDERIQFFCDGTLISERFILTTAHCSSHADYGAPTLVRLGVTNLATSDGGGSAPADIAIKRFIQFDGYDRLEHLHDIALIELEADVTFNKSFVRPACLQQDEVSEEKLVASGWGKTSTYSGVSDEIMKFEILMKPLSYCEHKLDLENLPNESQLCGLLASKECGGQGGSPIQSAHPDASCVYRVAGLASYGSPLCGSKYPLVYTKVSNYLDWIESHVWNSREK